MAIFKPLLVPRTNIASHNPILYDDGVGKQGFYNPTSKYFGWETIPHDNKWNDGTPSFMAPISHYHLLQIESFHVKSGSGYWYVNGKKIQLNAGEDIAIPRFIAHRFESIPNEKQEPLIIEYRYDEQMWEMEERFFRNILTYLDDCRKAKVEPSVLQLCCFLTDCWMPAEFLQPPGGEYLRCFVNTIFMWVACAIGMLFFGYKRSYIEYYDPQISRERISNELKEQK